jgi:molecular chaperone DnaJ
VAHDAPTQAIRASYRARARLHHPDRSTEADQGAVSMAEINEAYRVLSDPGRRAIYDRTIAAGDHRAASAGAASDADDDIDVDDEPEPDRRAARPGRVLSPDGPARFPWKPMLVVAAVGSALVLVSAALADAPEDEVPDGILRTDSCVVIEPNGDAREVACTGEDDIVVELLIPTDARCPVGMEPHRDRLGLGIACIVP